MSHSLTGPRIIAILASIRSKLREADKLFSGSNSEDYPTDEKENIRYYLETAFIQTLVLLETVGLTEIFRAVQNLNEEAKKDYCATVYSYEMEEPFLVGSLKLGQYISAIESIFGESVSGSVTNVVVDIVRATQYAITDRRCFPELPKNEADVHLRIEAVLRCVFPDLIHKPPISKPIKHFEPDTGLPEQKTLIEYKFISSKSEAKLVSDQILADTGGYISQDWNRFLYVIYETQRIFPERQWTEHLRKCGADENTAVVVICGEQPESSRPKS